jgi:hypothetical protein
MYGRLAASKSHFRAALRFHNGQPMIYSTIAERIFVQTNDSLVAPTFEEIQADTIEECLSFDDWEPWEDSPTN